MKVWLPSEDWVEKLQDAAPEASFDVYDGEGEVPDSADEVEFYVLPFSETGAGLALMADLPALRVAQSTEAGVEKVAPFVPGGVQLCNARGVHDAATSEHALTLTLTALRRMPTYAQQQAQRRWETLSAPGLADATVLILGYGSIGEAVERRLSGFEPAEILRVARSARDGVAAMTELPDLLPRADVVIVTAPLTDQTRGMVNAEFLRAMKDGALVVNVSRGQLVVTDDLLVELRAARLWAALDVTDPEPLAEDSPLWSAPQLVITPHTAGNTPAHEPRLMALLGDQLRRYAAGEDLRNVVKGAY